MTSVQFKLDMFEGPLDLLLHLINKHKLDIFDIEITLLIEQYLEYMEQLDAQDYDEAADFLAMAARLIYIKTVSLLPQDNEGEQLKKELEGDLIEYSICKQAAALLRERYAGGDIFVREGVKLPVDKTYTGERDASELLAAYYGMSEKTRAGKPVRANMFEPIVSRKIYSVTSKIIAILKRLYTEGRCELEGLLSELTEKSERVAAFLAVLELTRSGRILLNDDNTEIYLDPNAKNRRKKPAPEPEISDEELYGDQTETEEPREPDEDELISARAAQIMEEYHRTAQEPAETGDPAPDTEDAETAAENVEGAAAEPVVTAEIAADDSDTTLDSDTAEPVTVAEIAADDSVPAPDPDTAEPEPVPVTEYRENETGLIDIPYVTAEPLETLELRDSTDEPSKPADRSQSRTEHRPEPVFRETLESEPVYEKTEAAGTMRLNLYAVRYYWGCPEARELKGGLWRWGKRI